MCKETRVVMTTRMARITSKGQITVPKEVRDQLGVKAGDALEFSVDEGSEQAQVRPIKRRSIAEFRGIFRTDHAGSVTTAHTLPEESDWAAQRDRAWRQATDRLAGSRRADARGRKRRPSSTSG